MELKYKVLFNFEPKVAKHFYEFFFFKAKKKRNTKLTEILISFGTFLKKIVHSIVKSIIVFDYPASQNGRDNECTKPTPVSEESNYNVA